MLTVVRCLPLRLSWLALLLSSGPCAWAQSQPEANLIAGLNIARAAGCAGRPGIAQGMRRSTVLDEVASRVAQGASTSDASRQAGYRAQTLFQASFSGYRSTQLVVDAVSRQYCQALSNPRLSEVGVHRRGDSTWLVMAEPFSPPDTAQAGAVAADVLGLVNQARARPQRCGTRSFAAAGPLRANALLDQAAATHARDMAAGSYLEHRGRDGSDPARRASRVGYQWRSVGENIAAGQTTPEQVVADWLKSPLHCANLMAPAFSDMGVAFAVNSRSEGGIYWAQTLARPR